MSNDVAAFIYFSAPFVKSVIRRIRNKNNVSKGCSSLKNCYETSHLKICTSDDVTVSLAETKLKRNQKNKEDVYRPNKEYMYGSVTGDKTQIRKYTTIMAYPFHEFKANNGSKPSYPTQVSDNQGQAEVLFNSGHTSIIPIYQNDEVVCIQTLQSRNPPINNRYEALATQRGTPIVNPQNTLQTTISNHYSGDRRQGKTTHLTPNGTSTIGHVRPNDIRQPARHPEYADINRRQMTFTTWPPDAKKDPTNLRHLGFYYTGKGDLVRCYQCGIGLKDFCEKDDPLTEHVRYSTSCPFLIELLGPEELTKRKAELTKGHTYQQERQPPRPNHPPVAPGHLSAATNKQQQTTKNKVEYRHPEYRQVQVRISSFTKWPSTILQTPQQLAEAGFYFTGMRDVVRCWACDGGLQKWDPEDDPWIEHCKWFPTCPYARQQKGESYIALVRHIAAEENRKSTGSASRASPGKSRPGNLSIRLGELNIKNESQPTCLDEIRHVLEMGFPKEDVMTAVEKIKRKGTNHPSVNSIVDAIEDATEVQPEPQPEPNTASELQNENFRLKSLVICMMCNINDVNVLFLPCSHHRMCLSCVHSLTHCPICDMFIEEKVKTFMS